MEFLGSEVTSSVYDDRNSSTPATSAWCSKRLQTLYFKQSLKHVTVELILRLQPNFSKEGDVHHLFNDLSGYRI